MEKLLATWQVADLLGVSETTVVKLGNDGEIPFMVIGKRSRKYKPSDIEAFQDRKLHEARAATGFITNCN